MERKRGMKNIFKKLHIGSNHDPAPSNDAAATSSGSPSFSSDQRPSSGQNHSPSPAAPSMSTPSLAVIPPATAPAANRQDYYFSEEEYQVQLALALSVSNSDPRGDPENEQIRAATLLSLGGRGDDSMRDRDDAAADLLSRQYWDYGLLDYEEKVVDGFYDVYGLSPDLTNQGKMPSLSDLETGNRSSGYEVVIVNRSIDPALEEMLQIAHCIALDCQDADVSLLVQRLAELVTQRMGGPVGDANIIWAKWMERITELRTSLHTSVFPIGSLKVGLSRHRALLFKVLAENVGISSRLVKGSHYTGVEDDAVNIVKLANESEFLVDLMAAPGTLIPADIFSSKDSSIKSYNPNSSKLPSLQNSSDSEGVYSRPSLTFEFGQNSEAQDSLLRERISNSKDKETFPPSPSANIDPGVGSSTIGKRMPSTNQADHIPSSAIGSSVYKGGRGPNVVIDGSRKNVNLVPYDSVDDTKSLFADLNPFHIKGSGKGVVRNNPNVHKVDDLRGQNSNIVLDRPSVPLMWKSRHACNQIPRKKERDFVEGLFPKNQHEVGLLNISSLATTSSSASGNIHFDGAKLHDVSHPVPRENSDRDSSAVCNSESSLTEWKIYRLSLGVESNYKDKYQDEGSVSQNNELAVEKLPEKSTIALDRRNYTDDKMSGIGVTLKELESPNSLVDSSAAQVDPVMDDVGECEIPWEDLVIGERIGLGSYGEVYHADWNGTEVAVKKFLDQDFSGAALDEFKREVRIMQRLRHPNVVLFMGAVTRPPNLSIITEFLPRGSLYRIIHRPQCQIDEKRRIKMALDVAKGMNCLHTSIPTVVHRDLKSPNLLVDKNWNVKVSDFGLSRLKHNTFLSSKSTAGTPEWMAPEVLRNENSNEKCDVYSFGVILWELATLRLPWSGMNPMQVVGAVGFQNRRLDIPKDIDPLVATIIWECWQTDPNLRPSFAQLAAALKPLQRLAVPLHADQPSSPRSPEISVNSNP